MRDAKGRTTMREMNSLLVSLLVIKKSFQRRMMFSMVIRNILDQIQKKNIDQIWSHHLKFLMKCKEIANQLGVNYII